LHDAIAVIQSSGRKTVTVTDIIFVLNRVSHKTDEWKEQTLNHPQQGRPIYGFNPAFIR
jgi:histone H4